MKNTTLTGDDFDYQVYFDENYYQLNQMMNCETSALEKDLRGKDLSEESISFGNKCFSVIKWIFLYLPGATAIHFYDTRFFAFSFARFFGKRFDKRINARNARHFRGRGVYDYARHREVARFALLKSCRGNCTVVAFDGNFIFGFDGNFRR